MIVLSLCDRSTAFARVWAEDGFTVYAVDLQHDPGESDPEPVGTGSVIRVGADIRHWIPPLGEPVAFVGAFPPCTHLAVSGARWFREKGLRGLIDGLELVEACRVIAEASGAPWFLENPVSTLSSYWRKPDHTFHPWEYGGYEGGQEDGYTKRTCLWTGGGFRMPTPRPIQLALDHDRIHRAAPSEDRGDVRSVTPVGFARAVWHANRPRGWSAAPAAVSGW